MTGRSTDGIGLRKRGDRESDSAPSAKIRAVMDSDAASSSESAALRTVGFVHASGPFAGVGQAWSTAQSFVQGATRDCLVAGKFPAVLSYVLGPILGGIAGALVYDKVIARATAPEKAIDTDD